MDYISEITPDIFRLQIPFRDIYTTVFLIRTPEGTVIFDAATTPEDVCTYVFPALEKLAMAAPAGVVISHGHGDHAGGLPTLLERYPGLRVLRNFREGGFAEDGATVFGVLQLFALPGHSADSLALLDTRSATLLTGDSLQLYGIYGSGNWGANISLPTAHLAAVERIRKLNVKRIVASHDYHPHGYLAEGVAVDAYLDACPEALYRILAAIRSNPELDNQALAALYNAQSGLPTVGAHVFAAVRAAAAAGSMP